MIGMSRILGIRIHNNILWQILHGARRKRPSLSLIDKPGQVQDPKDKFDQNGDQTPDLDPPLNKAEKEKESDGLYTSFRTFIQGDSPPITLVSH